MLNGAVSLISLGVCPYVHPTDATWWHVLRRYYYYGKGNSRGAYLRGDVGVVIL
jgi:hypothetical protein